jgi:hypothetical protein
VLKISGFLVFEKTSKMRSMNDRDLLFFEHEREAETVRDGAEFKNNLIGVMVYFFPAEK